MSTADLVFGGCLLLGGGLLLLTLIFDDLFGGFLNAIHFGLDLGGVSPTPVLLGFVAMFGVGGLLGIHGFGVFRVTGVRPRDVARLRENRGRAPAPGSGR